MTKKVSAEPELVAKSALTGTIENFSKVAGILTIATAAAYVLGWQTELAYYGAFGAGWLVSDLHPSELLGAVSFPAILFTFGVVIFLREFSVSKYTTRRAIISAGTAVIGALVLGIASAFPRDHDYPGLAGWCLNFAGILLPLGLGGLSVCFLRAGQESPWDSARWSLLSLLLVVGILALPDFFGNTRARINLDPKTSYLPDVRLTNSADERWKLLRNNGTDLVLVQLGGSKHYPVIRVVPANTVLSVQAPSPDDVREGETGSPAVNAKP